MSTSGVRRALACLAVVGLAGCAGVPTTGPVRVVRHVPVEGPDAPEPRLFRHVASDPPANAAPDAIVRGYLTAQADGANDHAIARKYLAARVTWNPGTRVTVYATPSNIGVPTGKGDDATVALNLVRVGTISAQGEFRPPGASAATPITFHLHKIGGVGWRITAAPPGVLLSRNEVAASFVRTTLYWTDQARRLVPDLVFLPATDQPVARVVRALLEGPKGWLAPAVRTAFPAHTRLLTDPSIVDGVVTLNFSREIRGAPQETLGTLVAQLVWTLTETVLDVQAVRIDAEGDPLPVPGKSGQRDQHRSDWAAYGPVPATSDGRLFFVRNGAAYAIDDAGHSTRVGRAPTPLSSVAVNRSGTVLAAVARLSSGKQSLVLVDLTGAAGPRTVLVSDRISPPTWEPAGDYVWVAHTSGGADQVLVVPAGAAGSSGSAGASGSPIEVAAPVPGTITALRLSPDGARAVLVVGSGRAAALWMARVERPTSGGRVLGDPRLLVPPVSGVTAAAFDGATQVLFAATLGQQPALFHVDLDGYNFLAQRADGLPPGVIGALTVSAGSAGTPVDRVASIAGQLWRRTPGAIWAAMPGRGSAAAYAG